MDMKAIRKMTGMTQAAFGQYLSIPVVNIQHWEQGVANPPAYVKKLICRVLAAEKGLVFEEETGTEACKA